MQGIKIKGMTRDKYLKQFKGDQEHIKEIRIMKKWLIEQLIAGLIITAIIIPFGLANTFLQVWLYEN